MRFLDNVLTDYIARAPDEMARAKYSAERERSVGLGVMGFHSFLQARSIPFEGAMAKSWNLKIFKHIRAQVDEASMMLANERGPCPDAADMGVMERFSCKMAIAPTASISIICGGTSACIEPIPANVYTHKTLSGSFSIKNPHLEALLREKHKDSAAVWNSILEQGGSVQHLDFLTQEEKDVFKTSFEIDQRWLIELAADRTPFIDQAQIAEPVHPRRRRQMGPDDAPLPRLGAGHQVALLPPLQVGAARRFRRRGRGRQHARAEGNPARVDHRLRRVPGVPVIRERPSRPMARWRVVMAPRTTFVDAIAADLALPTGVKWTLAALGIAARPADDPVAGPDRSSACANGCCSSCGWIRRPGYRRMLKIYGWLLFVCGALLIASC